MTGKERAVFDAAVAYVRGWKEHPVGIIDEWSTLFAAVEALPVCTCGTDYGHFKECPVSIERQATCPHTNTQGWGSVPDGYGESWCMACGKKMLDNPRPGPTVNEQAS